MFDLKCLIFKLKLLNPNLKRFTLNAKRCRIVLSPEGSG